MNNITDISSIELAYSILALALPFAFLRWYKVPLIKSILISVLRMGLQLAMVALYLEVVFEWSYFTTHLKYLMGLEGFKIDTCNIWIIDLISQ